MAVFTGISLPIALAVIVFVATVVIGPFQEDVKEGVSASEPPLRVGIEESWEDDIDQSWVFDRPLPPEAVRELENLPSDQQAVVAFAAAHGGIRHSAYCLTSACDAAMTRFKLALTGRRRGEVRVTDITGRVVERRKPPTGARLQGPVGGSADIEAGYLIFEENPTTERLASEGEDGRPARAYFDEKFVHLALNEPVVFEILAVSSTWDISWEIVVTVTVDGKTEEMVVRSDGTPDGPPFRNPGTIHQPSAYANSFLCVVGAATCDASRTF
ncbi:hypothetical protein [Nonomuraea sp. PA05]|uniref:hypothetical protein n=1 Tax=Nonomuraea sp. PA05 TaxID=2604466 RepID=UPI0016524D58|nr:hypothetical protein [Nonomuraea sp. PA05]